MKKLIFFFLIFTFSKSFAQLSNVQKSLLSNTFEFSKTSAVTGREEEAIHFVKNLFEQGVYKQDRLGNIIITLGNGLPRRLFTTSLDEPGYVISQILDDGYLKYTPVGFGHYGNMFHQFYEGNEVKINTASNVQIGVSTVPSSHYDGLRAIPEKSKNVFQWQEAFVDLGVSNSKEVAEKGINLLDPITINKKPIIINDKYLAAPSANAKASVIALATVAQTLLQQKFNGTIVIAFTTLELINGKGLEAVVNKYGPFDEVVRFNRFLNSNTFHENEILVDKINPINNTNQKVAKSTTSFKHPSTNAPAWNNAKIYEIGINAKYISTPVEMIAVNSIEQLALRWLYCIENKQWELKALKNITPTINTQYYHSYHKEEVLLSDLVSKYGVNPDEKPVRDYILSKMPSWAKPTIDAKGNIILSFGKGKEHIAFVAHMDEVGFQVDSILSDGRLALKEVGGFFNWVWEGHSAIIHTKKKEINAIFEPRSNYLTETKRYLSGSPLLVSAGFSTKQEAIEAGIEPVFTTVTMPKKMIRLSESKATARGFDDRVGCAALLMALENLNPATLPYKVTFVWSTGEETGLVGSTYAANDLKDISIGYPIDTYVSSDAPMESKIFGYCPLGNGAIIRVLESINFVSRDNLKNTQNLAKVKGVKVQYGMTAGGTDGQGFLSNEIPSVPLSWPGRYSHSPIEVMDFNDMNNLVKLVTSIMYGNAKQ
jgi:putative aminopeptidase FrvX